MAPDLEQELVGHAMRIGADVNLVQGSGGNVSVKIGKSVLVKASGKQLFQAATQDIFLKISVDGLQQQQILDRDNFLDLVIPSDSETNHLSPSIETNLHLLMPQVCVTHIHSLGSIIFGFIDLDRHSLEEFEFEHRLDLLNYGRPGRDLAGMIAKLSLADVEIVILKNHGSIFVGQNFKEIEGMIESFEIFALDLIASLPLNDSFPAWFEILTGGVMTPDEAVFLGANPFSFDSGERINSVIIDTEGILSFPEKFNSDQIKIAEFYVFVARHMHRKIAPEYLCVDEVETLLGWDKEKIRIAMSK
jgi:ribulose-5-phosphate 4-epimerase/fuculose-1-phosphate aldolase